MSRNRRPRAVLAVAALAGVPSTVLFALRNPGQVGFATDVYYAAARAALAGRDFYAVNPVGDATFQYPPAVVAAFYPHALLGDPALALALQTLVNLAALVGLAALVVRTAERGTGSLARVDRALLVAFVFLAGPVGVNLVMGQVNPVLALGLAGGAVALERGRDRASGAALGATAAVKLFPALVGVWLCRRRAWRAIAAATATGVGAILAGVLLFGPGATETYVAETLSGELSVASFPDGPDPTAPFVTVRRQLTYLAPSLSGTALLAAGLAVVAPVYAGVNRVVADPESRLVALQGTLTATLLVFPLEPFYVVLAVFPLAPLLYRLDPGTPRTLLLAGTLLVSVPVLYESVVTLTAPLPGGISSAIRGVSRDAFAFVLPPTIGAWLVLAGCLLYQHRAATEP
ncbi:glycosyltransferase family 87 protein [Halobacterium litoreum]|uniref:Glycosyltransferase family 87 protein n=1 Tax=Halobacterium litoreum TaxID=2039234 RepID=A0ABD5NGF8_9EURY|nr:glycosyltransferase family 87 protein [Halobacterium litoreum]UHH12755.1 DUF2029 domain-containing protein [Halobacterium litoreum]